MKSIQQSSNRKIKSYAASYSCRRVEKEQFLAEVVSYITNKRRTSKPGKFIDQTSPTCVGGPQNWPFLLEDH